MNESNNYNELDESFKYFEKQYAYQKLEENQQTLTTSQSSYYYYLKNSNIGRFEQIYREIENNNIENAKTLNDQISPVNTIETNRKWVNSVYFDYIVPQKSIPQNIIDELEILASSSPFVRGDAVYSARAIVGYTEDEIGIHDKNLEVNPNSNTTNDNNIEIKVFPNPAQEFISVEIIGNTDKSIKFDLTNMLGIKVLEKVILGSNSFIKIDVQQLRQGVYVYEASYKNNRETIIKGRIVIN